MTISDWRTAAASRKRGFGFGRLGALTAAGLVAFGLLGPGASPSAAQTVDLRGVAERLDRMEREMQTMQRQLYRGEAPSSLTPGQPGPASPAPMGGSPAVAHLDSRMSQLEQELRNLTGRLEELGHAVDRMNTRMDTLVADLEYRLAALEGGEAPAPAPAGPTAAAPAAPIGPLAPADRQPGARDDRQPAGLAPLPDPQTQAGDPRGPAQQPPRALGGPITPPPASASPGTQTAALPAGTARDQYEQAFALLRRADYDAAEQALRGFVEAHPEDELAGNAQYWLGETYYVRGNYEQAAVEFLEGYQQFPGSGKAPDNLLKLGMSLSNLGKTAEACASFTRLSQEFPNASAAVRDRASAERARLNCG